MTYDNLDRLTSTTSPMFGSGASYTYDELDNLTRVTTGGTAARDHYYCYDASQRLTNVKTGSYGAIGVIGLGYYVQGNLDPGCCVLHMPSTFWGVFFNGL